MNRLKALSRRYTQKWVNKRFTQASLRSLSFYILFFSELLTVSIVAALDIILKGEIITTDLFIGMITASIVTFVILIICATFFKHFRFLRDRLAATLRISHVGSWSWKPESQSFSFSKEASNLLGIKNQFENFDIEKLLSIVRKTDHNTVASYFHSFETDQRQAATDFGVHLPDGTVRIIQINSDPVKLQANKAEILGTVQDITGLTSAQSLINQTAEVLEMIATGRSASSIYDAIALMYEARHPGLRCSMLELRDGKLIHGGAPSLPKTYCDAVNGLEYGPSVGSCGTSTYTGKRVLVEDIASDPKWAEIKHVALPHGMRSCWSEPIKDTAEKVLGAFGMYYNHPALPDKQELIDMESAARLAGIIMERERRERDLRQSENKYRTLVENLPQRFFLKDNNFEFVSCSKNLAEDLGITLEQIVGTTDADYFPTELAEHYRHDDQRIMQSKVAEEIDEAIIIDGEERHIHTVKAPALDEDGNVEGIIGIFWDVTDHKLAEKALLEERGFLATLLDNIEEAVVSCDAEGVLARFNRSARRLHGIPEEKIPPEQWAEHYDLYHADGCTKLRRGDIPLFRALQGEYVREAEMVVALKNSPPRSLVANAQPLTDPSGKVLGAVVSMHDITERKLADAQVKEALKLTKSQQESVMAILNNIPFLAWLKDKEGRFIAVNEHFSSACSAPAPQWLVGKTDLDIWPEELAYAYRKDDQEVMASGKPKALEEQVAEIDGAKWFETFKTPVYDGEGKIAGTTGLARDITEQKMLEEKLRQAQKMESVGTLVGGVAHEFNNTLAGITGRLYLAKSSAENNPDVIRHIDKVSTLSFRAAEMIQQLLTFSRKGPVQMKAFDLSVFSKETLKLHRFSIPENIKVEAHFSHYALPIVGDATQLQQILVNLLHNARDALIETSKPQINVTIELFEADKSFMTVHPNQGEKHFAHLMVEDNGCGISESDRANIFDPFFTTKEVGKGTGLGLAMVYGAIQTHNGIIEVDSELDKGTCMHIYIPLASAASENEQITEAQPVHGRGESILFVDDEAELRETGREVLESLGYTILEASNGVEAVEIFTANQSSIGLVIMDIVMPEMGGFEAATAMKAHDKDVKIIFCTGYDKEDVLDDINVMDNPVITKPYSIDSISRMIREALSH